MKNLIAIAFFFLLAGNAFSRDLCAKDMEANVLASNLDAKGKYGMLKGMGCVNIFTDDYEKRVADQRAVEEKLRLEREAAAKAELARREEEAKKQRVEAQIAAEKEAAERDAYEQAMADKCGEYPLDVTIGMSEKLLKMGCAGQADLVAEREGGIRVYQLAYQTVSVRSGRVVLRIAR